MKVELDYEEWQRVMAMMALAPWAQANPLLMKIGEQLRQQGSKLPGDPAHMPGETHAASGHQTDRRGNSGADRVS